VNAALTYTQDCNRNHGANCGTALKLVCAPTTAQDIIAYGFLYEVEVEDVYVECTTMVRFVRRGVDSLCVDWVGVLSVTSSMSTGVIISE
jgi:hypothetical protein